MQAIGFRRFEIRAELERHWYEKKKEREAVYAALSFSWGSRKTKLSVYDLISYLLSSLKDLYLSG